jgi:ABC-type cobalamin transport system ATPase subunit
VRKSFGRTVALDGLDLEVASGEIHGFLGPNGAGKTVTMRILLGLVRHNAGTVQVLGGDPWADAVALHRRIAYVPGDTNLWPNLTGGEILDVLAGLRGGNDPRRQAHLVERFDLDLRRRARSYSKGNRQKVALVAARTVRPVDDIGGLPGVHDVRFDDGRVRFDVDGAQLDTAVAHLVAAGLQSLTSAPPTLEELFLRHYGDELAEP